MNLGERLRQGIERARADHQALVDQIARERLGSHPEFPHAQGCKGQGGLTLNVLKSAALMTLVQGPIFPRESLTTYLNVTCRDCGITAVVKE